MSARPVDPHPLDEIQWRSPVWVQMNQGIHSNSVLHYFSNSPFFDPTSNNAVLLAQASFNPNLHHILATREAFEGRLQTMSGLEYIVAQEPAEMAPGTGTGVWVIRKQTRRKRPGQPDEITILSTYFVVSDNIYMAPAVGDVIGNRLLSIFTSLEKFLTTAATLPTFSAATGHMYMPPAPSIRPKAIDSQPNRSSKELSPLADSLSGARRATTMSGGNAAYAEALLLDESLNMTIRFGDEYMDENPITGHPGDFHLSSTGRQNKDKLTAALLHKGPSQRATAPPTPEPKAGEAPIVAKKANKGDKSPRVAGMPKPKRRKSKAPLSGGTTPS